MNNKAFVTGDRALYCRVYLSRATPTISVAHRPDNTRNAEAIAINLDCTKHFAVAGVAGVNNFFAWS